MSYDARLFILDNIRGDGHGVPFGTKLVEEQQDLLDIDRDSDDIH